MNNLKGTVLILISALMYGSYGVWSRLIGESFDVFYQGWSRALIIVVLLLPVLIKKKELVAISREDWRWFLVYLLFAAAVPAPIFYAFNHMDIGSATLLFFVSMLLTMNLFGVLFLKERLTKIKLVSIVLAIIGMYVIFSFSLTYFALIATMMAIFSGLVSGGEISSSKKLTGNYSALYVSWLGWIMIALTNAPMSLFLGEAWHVPSFELVWLYQLSYALFSFLAFWLVIEGLKTIEAGIGGLLGLMEIVFSVMFGVIVFSEELTARVIVGALLIIAASALPNVIKLGRRGIGLLKKKEYPPNMISATP